MKKRILASLLSLLMVFSLTPTVAFATEVDEEVILVEAGTGEADEAEAEAEESGSRCTLTEGCSLEAGHESSCVVRETAEAEAETGEETAATVLGSTPSLTASGSKLSSNGGTLSAGSYYLDGNVTLKSNITIPENTTVTIDLNGKTLTGTGSGSVITVYGTLNLKDTSTNGNGKITGGSATFGAGVRVEGGVFNMTGGAISGNTAATWGGGVYISSDGSFTMTGGTISGNSANDGGGVYVYDGDFFMRSSGTSGSGIISDNTASVNGGGVAVGNGGGFYMSDGTISGNSAELGGGVYVVGVSGIYGGTISDNTATVNGGGVCVTGGSECIMTGGTIKNNTANGNGGGVHVTGSLEMTGGTITGNSVSSGFGGGVCIRYLSSVYGSYIGSLTVSGSPVITDNSDTGEGCTSNVFLESGTYITLGSLSSDASIGVAHEDSSSLKVQITSTEAQTEYYKTAASIFSSDNANYIVRSNSAGYLELCVNNLLEGSVTIQGTSAYGETLTAALSDEVPAGVTYQWMRGTETITGATGSAYTLTAEDVGKTIYVVVSHADYAGTLSASSGVVQKADPTITLSGTAAKAYDGRAVSAPVVSVTLVGSDVYSGTPSAAWYLVTADGDSLLDGAPLRCRQLQGRGDGERRRESV